MNDELKKVWAAVFEKVKSEYGKEYPVIIPALVAAKETNEIKNDFTSTTWPDRYYPIFLLGEKAPESGASYKALLIKNGYTSEIMGVNFINAIGKKTWTDNEYGWLFSKDAILQIALKIKNPNKSSNIFAGEKNSLLFPLTTDYEWNLDDQGKPQTYKDICEPKPITEKSKEMTMKEQIEDQIRYLLENNHQVILTGAPGTGKTYTAREIAKKLAGDESRVEFVQFHPGFDYSDFVEGLKPNVIENNDGKDGVTFEKKSGIFKKFCERAKENFIDSQKTQEQSIIDKQLDNSINDFLEDAIANEVVFKTSDHKREYKIEDRNDKTISISAHSTQKQHQLPYCWIREILGKDKDKDLKNVGVDYAKKCIGVTIKNNYSEHYYALAICREIQEFIRNRPKISHDNTNNQAANKTERKNFVFIIDEINRADLSRVFGELFFGLEETYRGEPIKTQYSYLPNENGKSDVSFTIPENVYIIGTMNDIDRSVESMDFALRRRFAWYEIKAEDSAEMLASKFTDDDELLTKLTNRMNNLNNAIIEKDNSQRSKFGTEYQLGGAYFLKYEKYKDESDPFTALWKNHIAVILKEYLRGHNDADGVLKKWKEAYDNENKPKESESL